MQSVSRLCAAWVLGSLVVGGIPALTTAHAQEAAPVATDSRVKTFVFNENDVYNLLTYYGFQSNIEFGPKEKVETVSIGDRAGWQVVPAGRRLFVRAVADNLHTNMTVVTNLRAYQFDMRATDPANIPQEELVYVIRFFYPEDNKNQRSPEALLSPAPAYPTGTTAMPAAVAAPAYPAAPTPGSISITETPPAALPSAYEAPPMTLPTPAPVAAATSPLLAPQYTAPEPTPAPQKPIYGAGPFDTPLPATAAPQYPSNPTPAPAPQARAVNTNYTFEGANQLLPKAIFDDGSRTFLDYQGGQVPDVYVWAGNSFVPANPTLEGRLVVLPTVSSRIMLRGGNMVATMYNETRQ